MPKTSSSNTKAEESSVIQEKKSTPEPKKLGKEIDEEKKSTPKPKKLGKEIDDIFAGKKRKNPEAVEKQNEDHSGKPKAKVFEKKMKTKKEKKLRSEGDKEFKSRDEPARSKRKTEDGFTIYTEEELGLYRSCSCFCAVKWAFSTGQFSLVEVR